MKPLKAILAFMLLLAMAVPYGYAQEEMEPAEEMPEMGPPPQMKELAGLVGTWKYKGQMRWDPEAEWTENEAKAVYKYAAGGAVLLTEYEGMIDEMMMHGLGLMTYDSENEEWVDVWVDNIAGRMSIYTGQTEDGRRIVSGTDIMNGEAIYTRTTTYDITKNSFKWMMENSIDGEEWYISMQGVYTRQK
jgi:hypothetical protein